MKVLSQFKVALTMLVVLAVVALVSVLTGHPLGAILGGGAGVFALGTVQTDNDYIRNLIAWGLLDNAGGAKKLGVLAKTTAYSVVAAAGTTVGDPSGTVFTNRGAVGSVTFTLPAPALNIKGTFYDFVGVADQIFIVSAGAGLGVAFNNAACASLAAQTGGQKIGARIRAICDGASWLLEGTTVGVTYTVA